MVVKSFAIDEDLAVNGMRIYGTLCSICHGGQAIANAMSPDLRASGVPLDPGAFASIVRDGLKVNRGMPAFNDLSDEELESLRHYIRAIAHYHAGEYEN